MTELKLQKPKHNILIDKTIEKLDLAEHPDLISFSTLQPTSQIRTIFLNARSGSSKGFRLTRFGISVFIRAWEHWIIEVPNDFKATPSWLATLDNDFDTPWGFDESKLTLFNEASAMLLKLGDGNPKTIYRNVFNR